MATETVTVGSGQALEPTAGTAGVNSQLPGNATTVSAVASATGGVGPGNLIDRKSVV